MAQDLMKTIGALQETAIGRCRKRIADAALRARGLVGDDPAQDRPASPENPSYGVTSFLKRKHGL